MNQNTKIAPHDNSRGDNGCNGQKNKSKITKKNFFETILKITMKGKERLQRHLHLLDG